MIYSLLDIVAPRAQYTARGSYYKHEPNDLTDGAQTFSYEYLDLYSRTYSVLFGGVQAVSGEQAIRTRDRLDLQRDERGEVGGIVITGDGRAFKVIQSQRDYSRAPKQAFRILGMPVGYTTALRLVEIDNPWGLK